MTSNQLAHGVPVHFDQPFAGVGYGMNLGIVLDPARADFNGGGLGADSFYWGGVHGTWFWVDPVNDLIVVGMVQQESAGNPPTGRPYPMPDIRGISRPITYRALVDPALWCSDTDGSIPRPIPSLRAKQSNLPRPIAHHSRAVASLRSQ
jgi:CubicO group peptidase (beta-lactamase class C family)